MEQVGKGGNNIQKMEISNATSNNNNKSGIGLERGLTDAQRAMIEENRRKAREKRKNATSSFTSQKSASTIQCCPSPNILNAEQRARIEANRLKAIERRQQMTMMSQTTTAAAIGAQPIATTATLQSPVINEEQKARIEANRRRALEKLEKKQLSSQNNSATISSSIKCPSPSINTEQKARIEENRRKALERKQRSQSQLLASSSTSSSSTAANMTVQTGEGRQKASDMDMKEPATGTPKKSGLPVLPPDLHYEESRVLPIYDEDLDTLISNANLEERLLNGWELFAHQKEGLIRALKMRRLILAFDMGLGKTIIGCVWAKAFLKTFEGIKIFVIAPVSLHDDWKRTATDATGLRIDNTGDKKKKGRKKAKKEEEKKKKPKSEKTVTGKLRKKTKIDSFDSDNEDNKSDEDAENAFDLHILSWNSVNAYKQVITDIDNYVVICDEAHNMQTMSSKRTEEALKLMFPKKCRGILLLTGTPMKNGKPANLFPLLKAVCHPFGDNQRRYEFFFCNGQQKMFRGQEVWDAAGSSNLKELNAHTASHIFRMTKEECMSKELSPRCRIIKTVPVAPLHQTRYSQALKDLAQAYTLSSASSGGENDDILGYFQKIRQISSFGKVDAVVALCNQILIEESSIVIFTNFVSVAKEIYSKLEGMSWAGELLCGETPPRKRQAMVDMFQSGLSPVFVCTYGAGGVGLTLTAACTVLLVDRPWTPGDVCQAEDRVRRIGQKRPTRSIWIRAFPIDEQIDELINHKEETSNTAVDGKGSANQNNRNAPKVSISQLIQSVLGA